MRLETINLAFDIQTYFEERIVVNGVALCSPDMPVFCRAQGGATS